jgi:hypothetical protein
MASTRKAQLEMVPARTATRMLAVALAVLSTLAALLLISAAPASARVDPTKDTPYLPTKCGGGTGALMPQNRGACPLKAFHSNWPTVLIWGDSHAWEYTPALRKLTAHRNVNLVAFTRGGCPPMEAPNPDKKSGISCVASNNDALHYVEHLSKQGPRVQVILASNWVTYRNAWIRADAGEPQPADQEPYVEKMAVLAEDGIPRLLGTLGAMQNVRTDVVSSVLRVPSDAPSCASGENPYSCDLPRSQAIPDEADTKNWLANEMGSLKPSARLIDVNSHFCETVLLRGPICHGMIGPDSSVHTFYDDLHISATASKQLTDFFAKSIPSA